MLIIVGARVVNGARLPVPDLFCSVVDCASMASKVLVPAAPFAKLQVKKSPPDSGSGFIIGGDPAARVAHLEHSVRFLQEQHRLMLSGLHAEIEALRERNRDLQFQLIFNKESSPKTSPAITEDTENSEEANLKREVGRLEREAAAARGEARAAEARALQLQRLVDAQAEKLRDLEVQSKVSCSCSCSEGSEGGAGAETRGELRARLSSAERLVRRLRADAERQRREVHAPAPPAPGGAVTNLLFDGAAARHAHLQCMKNSLHASLRASGLDGGYGYQNNYHFPPVHAADFWREPVRDDLVVTGAGAARGRARRPITLPDLTHHVHRSTVYANNHARSRANGYEHKHKKMPQTNGEVVTPKTPEDIQGCRLKSITSELPRINRKLLNRPVGAIYPELKVVVTKLIPREHVSSGAGEAGGEVAGGRGRARRVTHRKHAPDHT